MGLGAPEKREGKEGSGEEEKKSLGMCLVGQGSLQAVRGGRIEWPAWRRGIPSGDDKGMKMWRSDQGKGENSQNPASLEKSNT